METRSQRRIQLMFTFEAEQDLATRPKLAEAACMPTQHGVHMFASTARLSWSVLLPLPVSRCRLLSPPAQMLYFLLPLPQQLSLTFQEHRQAALLHRVHPAAHTLRLCSSAN